MADIIDASERFKKKACDEPPEPPSLHVYAQLILVIHLLKAIAERVSEG